LPEAIGYALRTGNLKEGVDMVDYYGYETYFNGEWVPYRDVKLSPEDRGFGVADAVFDIARTFNGKPFVLDYHIDRLYRSLKYVRMDSGLSPEEMTAICEEGVTTKRNEPRRGRRLHHPPVDHQGPVHRRPGHGLRRDQAG
jgi:branched-subunit amino acid aminotransferase/4-amino-4-deoxychorismate lyase